MRRDRALSLGAFLLVLTALLLPWWTVTFESSWFVVRDSVSVFRPEPPLTTDFGPWLTGLLAVAVALLLFVRLAGNSHVHEPRSWRRDLAVAGALLVAAAASCLFWPEIVPSFWGGRTHSGNLTDGEPVTETAMPGLGWWLAVLAAALCFAAWRSVPREAAPQMDGTVPEQVPPGEAAAEDPGTTDK